MSHPHKSKKAKRQGMSSKEAMRRDIQSTFISPRKISVREREEYLREEAAERQPKQLVLSRKPVGISARNFVFALGLLAIWLGFGYFLLATGK
jgi:hypothetical protein